MKQPRDEGFSKTDCVPAIAKIKGKAVGEAKEMVHFSPAWEDRREHDEQFHDALIDAAGKIDWSEG